MFQHFDGFGGYATGDLPAQYGIAGGTVGAFGPGGTKGLRDPAGLFKPLSAVGDRTFIAGAFFTFRTAFVQGFLHEAMSGGSIDIRRSTYLKVKATGKLTVNDIADSAATLSLGVVYFIQILAFLHDTLGTCEVRVYDVTNAVDVDVSDLTRTGIDTQGGTITGWDGYRSTCSNVDMANLFVADGSGAYNNSFLEVTAIDELFAQADSVSGAGFNNGWTRSTGTDQGANVAKTTPATTPYNSTATVDAKDTYNLPNMTSTGGTRAIKANFYAQKTDNVPRTIAPVLRIGGLGGADYDMAEIDVPAGWEYLTQIIETNPLTGFPFTNADIASLQLGQKLPTQVSSATKFYLHNAAAAYSPATLRGAWDQTAGAVTKALDPGTRGGGESTTIAIAETNASATFDVLLYRGVSGPLAAQTIAGTVNVVIGVLESAAAADMNWHLHIYVTQGDSDTPRGTLLTDYTEALGVNEWSAVQLTFKGLNAAQTLSSLAIQAGDRIVVEIGYISREASATSRTGTLSYGTLSFGKRLSDGAVAGVDTTTKAGFVQFSQAIAFSAAPAVRVAQVYLEVLSPDIPIVDDPSGGGDPGVGVEPTNGTSLCGADPVYKTVRVQTDSGEKRYSYGDLPLGDTFREARVLSIGPIRRALSDINGRIETARTTIKLSDYDGTLRGLDAAGVLLNKRVDVYAATETQLRANATERRLASLLIRDYKFGPGLTCALQCEDYFGSVVGEYGARMMVPKRLLTTTDFPGLPAVLIGTPVPIGYGLLSDEFRGPNAIGRVPAFFVGTRRLSDGLDWDEYLLFGHAAASWQSVFASDLRDVALWDPASLGSGPRPVKMDLASLEGTEFLVPTHAGWNSIVGTDTFVDYNGHRYSVIYARGQRSLDARSGQCPISINVGGVEDVGDGTGTLIDAYWFQVLHFINNWWIQSYQTGDWLPYPTVNGTYSRIATQTFDQAQYVTGDRLGDLPWSGGTSEIGYKGSWMLGQDHKQKSIGDAVAQLLRDGDGELGVDRHGRIMASVMDPAGTSVASFVDTQQEIVEGSFDANRRMSLLNNRVTIKFEPNYILDTRPDSARTGQPWYSDFYFMSIDVSDAASISAVTGIGEERELKMEAWSLSEQATAADVGDRKLARRKAGPIYSEFTTGLCGDDVDLGDYYKVTSEEGMETAGWVDELHRCEAITYYLDDDLVQLEGQVAA